MSKRMRTVLITLLAFIGCSANPVEECEQYRAEPHQWVDDECLGKNFSIEEMEKRLSELRRLERAAYGRTLTRDERRQKCRDLGIQVVE